MKHLKLLIILILFKSSFALATTTCTTDICDLPASGSTKIYRHGICYTFDSTRTDKLMIPTKTQTEYQSFIDAVTAGTNVTNVTKTACTPITPTYIGNKEFNDSSSTTVYTTFPTGATAGDLILIDMYQNTDPLTGITTTATATFSSYQIIAGYYNSQYYKILTAADITAGKISFTKAAAFKTVQFQVGLYRNVDQTNPVGDKTQNKQASGTVTYNSVTVGTASGLFVAVGEAGSGATGAISGWASNINSSATGVRFSSKTATSTGASGNFTGAGTFTNWVATLYILNPGY